MSVPPGTEMFQFPGFAPPAYGFSGRYPSRGGLPHSDIHGSTPARGSPWLFAACHVLHRLLVPRHPPNALLALEINRIRLAADPPPCTGTIPGQTRKGQGRRPFPMVPSLSTHITPLTPASRGREATAHAATTLRSDLRPPDPETHQNPIHPDKDHTAQPRQRAARPIRHTTRNAPVPAGTRMETTRMETIGVEPTTPCLQSRCSPS